MFAFWALAQYQKVKKVGITDLRDVKRGITPTYIRSFPPDRKNLVKFGIRKIKRLGDLPSSGVGYFHTTVCVRDGPSADATYCGCYYAGETVNYDSVVENEGRTWISYIASCGDRHYCCAIDQDGSVYITGGDTPTPSPPGGLPIPLYYQWEYDYPYGDGTIANCGCGPTAYAMVASYVLGTTISPIDAVAWCGDEYYCYGQGTYWSYFQAASDHFGTGDLDQTGSGSEAYSGLGNGKAVISVQGPGIFTHGGHFIVLRGLDENGLVYVNDPNDNDTKDFKDRHFDFYGEIDCTSNQYWIFP